MVGSCSAVAGGQIGATPAPLDAAALGSTRCQSSAQYCGLPLFIKFQKRPAHQQPCRNPPAAAAKGAEERIRAAASAVRRLGLTTCHCHASEADLQPVASTKAEAASKGKRDAGKSAAVRAAAAARPAAAARSGGSSGGRRPGRQSDNRGTEQCDLQGLHAAARAGWLASKRARLSEWTCLETHGERLVCVLGTCGGWWSAPIRPSRAGSLLHGGIG